MLDDCFRIEVGRFYFSFGLESTFVFVTLRGTGFIMTLEFLRKGKVDCGWNITEDFGPAGINLEAFTIYGALVEFAFYLSLCSKFFRALYFLIFSFFIYSYILFFLAYYSALFCLSLLFLALCDTKE